MHYKIPIDELYKYSLKISVYIAATAFVTIYVMESNIELILFRTFMAFVQFYGCFLINIFVYQYLQKRMEVVNERIKIPIGIFLSIIFTAASIILSQYMISVGWFPDTVNDLRFVEIYKSWKIYWFVPFLATMIFMICHFFHGFVILANITRQSELEVVRLQSANMESTIQLLKQQIQPHFLFNALNTLKSLIRKQPALAEDYVIQLSDFLRTSISSQRMDVVSLHQELELCENYMAMQKIRFGDALYYDVKISQASTQRYVIPIFSLQPLLENAIKHNESTKQFPLTISIYEEDGYIIVQNNLRIKKFVEPSTGNGLTNLSERYRILFNEKVVIDQTSTAFIVKIKLIENENSSH